MRADAAEASGSRGAALVKCSRQSAALLGAKRFSTFWHRAQAKSAVSRQKARAACNAFTPIFDCGSSGSSPSAAAQSSSQRCTVSHVQGRTPWFFRRCARRAAYARASRHASLGLSVKRRCLYTTTACRLCDHALRDAAAPFKVLLVRDDFACDGADFLRLGRVLPLACRRMQQ